MFFRTFLFCFLTFPLLSQVGTGEWRLHVASKKAINVASNNKIVFAAFENGLVQYDIESNEISGLNAVNGLSDINISALCYNEKSQSFYVGYNNGNLDKITNGTITNIPALKLSSIPGNKRINKLISKDNYLYLATGFSIVQIDVLRDEVKDTWYPTNGNEAILDIAFRADSVFALTSNTMLRAHVNNVAIADPSSWSIDSRLEVLSNNDYTDIEVIDNQMYVLYKVAAYGQDSVYRIENSGKTLVSNESLEIYSLDQTKGKLVINADGAIYFYNSDLSKEKIYNSYGLGQWIAPLNCFTDENNTWVADKDLGLFRINNEFSMTKIELAGPPKEAFYSMDWEDGQLAVAGGGLSAIAATYNAAGVYLFKDEKWTLHDRFNTPLWLHKNMWDALCVAIDPKDSKKVAIGTFSPMALSIIENGSEITDTLTAFNSSLEFLPNGSALISSMEYDDKGNLWILNGYSTRPLKVYTKDKEWQQFDCGFGSINTLSKKLIIDYKGNKWFSFTNSGLIGYNDNDTPTNVADDKRIVLNTGSFSGALPSNAITAIAVDFDHEIWIGTDNGFAVLYNSDAAFDAAPGEYNAQRIKVNFEGNVEYVLGNTHITDIEVDGGNRKWFATASAGIVLLSPDGQTIIQQYTTENSPLISNNIIDLQLDHNTGELYIITDKGLISLRTDATYQDEDYSNVKVFPNPSRPNYDGVITIQGIQYDSDVKITDAAGNLVYSTTSNGGTATWNGKTLNGDKAVTGVYLIWTAPNEGKGRKVGKVLIVN